jgi:flagellin-like hook-associated protein FlgL
MTTIGAHGYNALVTQRADTAFRSLKSELSDLQTQLSTGKRASTYAALGSGAITSLNARARLAALDGYAANVGDAQLRLKLMATGIEQIDKIGRSLTVSLSDNYELTPIGQTSAIASATDGLKQIIDILNTDLNGRALFGGRDADGEPVVPYDLMVEGDGTRAGLRQMIAERREADLGADGRGRLSLTNSETGITVAEAAAGLPFGMKISGAEATGPGLTATTAAGPPASASLAVSAQPASGDHVALTLRLPDGSTTTLTFTAGADPGSDPNGFPIGASAAETAANLQAVVTAAIGRTAGTTLAAASALGASQAFFAGSSSNPPLRVAGPPYATATTTIAGMAANTVIWYGGEDAAGSARETAPVRTGEGTAVAIGARANEEGFRRVIAALGALVGQDFPAGNDEARLRYAATVDAVAASVGTAMQSIVSDFAAARAALDAAKERLGLAQAQVADTIAGVEDADPNEVAMKLLATQTRLQASYQTTSVISKLSLVDFL